MPELGEIRRGAELGFRSRCNHVWQACEECGRQRWVQYPNGKAQHKRCFECAVNSRSHRIETIHGYIRIRLKENNFFYSMVCKDGYVLEHRLIVAKALGRNLHPWEIVHHKGTKYPKGSIENKQDNRYPENLKLVQEMQHNQITIMENKIDKLLDGQKELLQEIRILRLQNKLLREDIGTKEVRIW
ncbi:hypothetical protein LCGC14_1617840 [marine sediment metagenome]|uniref:HNH nuclease domain-containing protein n=1 Tax=marine sediment metagenome TaxID=412755 RepID=A0A0F9I6N6_9ZZZZ